MQTTNNTPNSRSTDPEWCFLGEYPLNELMIEMDNRDRIDSSSLFVTTRAMGIHQELLSNIESKLMGFVKESMAHLNQGRAESPVYIRLFYRKKTIEDVNSTKSSSRFSSKQKKESTHDIHHSDFEINGGWGFFLIGRSGCFTPSSPVCAYNLVDLYLYREGE